jgi:hypothetical protein
VREDERAAGQVDEIGALHAAMPRPLIADGSASALADWWVRSRSAAHVRGLPRFARHAMSPVLQNALFEARRARRLERGLEGAEKRLETEQAGLRHAARARGEPEPVRISRLLLVSGDGLERFYREVEKLRARFENRLEVLLLDCDESALGGAGFGEGRRARALLIHHKDSVIRFLSLLEPTGPAGEAVR